MKGFWIVGGVIVVGAVTYGLYRYYRNQEVASETRSGLKSADDNSLTPEIVPDDTLRGGDVISCFEKTQFGAVVSIVERHLEVEQQLESTPDEAKQPLESALGVEEEDSDEFEEKIHQVNADLDDLLK